MKKKSVTINTTENGAKFLKNFLSYNKEGLANEFAGFMQKELQQETDPEVAFIRESKNGFIFELRELVEDKGFVLAEDASGFHTVGYKEVPVGTPYLHVHKGYHILYLKLEGMDKNFGGFNSLDEAVKSYKEVISSSKKDEELIAQQEAREDFKVEKNEAPA